MVNEMVQAAAKWRWRSLKTMQLLWQHEDFTLATKMLALTKANTPIILLQPEHGSDTAWMRPRYMACHLKGAPSSREFSSLSLFSSFSAPHYLLKTLGAGTSVLIAIVLQNVLSLQTVSVNPLLPIHEQLSSNLATPSGYVVSPIAPSDFQPEVTDVELGYFFYGMSCNNFEEASKEGSPVSPSLTSAGGVHSSSSDESEHAHSLCGRRVERDERKPYERPVGMTTSQSNFTCDRCFKTFKASWDLKRHQRTRKYKANRCGASTASESTSNESA
ncbi:hypothetical protein VNI00_006433 [Paramarasmius palmivorus]|uniref:C2H2-type domain-containing protein n=1 Tax=Paramarasmius palmivorus TaxID=297713 RepID=A0AAW0D8X7_9AGAR